MKKIIITIILLLIPISIFAQPIFYEGQWIEMNDKYSFKNFTNQDLSKEKDLKNINIYSSTFYQQCGLNDTPGWRHIFPEDMKGVTFYNCDLNNVYVPPGNTIIDPCGRHKLLKEQNDRTQWILNEDLSPKAPLHYEYFIKLGISTDPKDIPLTPMIKNLMKVKEDEKKDSYIINP